MHRVDESSAAAFLDVALSYSGEPTVSQPALDTAASILGLDYEAAC